MSRNQRWSEALKELEAALETEDGAEKNYHVREALQLLELDGELDSDDADEPARS